MPRSPDEMPVPACCEDNACYKVCLCCPCRWVQRTSFQWARRRYVWRSTFMYNVLTIVVIVGNALTFALLSIISGRDFFKNYRCGKQAISLINTNFVAMMGVTGIMGLCALMMSRLTNMFSNYSLSDFMSIGKWADRLGCLVKWLPWLVAVSAIGWITINFVNITWILADPKSWCARRWSERGTAAVVNCRRWFRGKVPCMENVERAEDEAANVQSCNDGEFLEQRFFFLFTPKNADQSCSFSDIAICRAFKEKYSAYGQGQEPDWKSKELESCTGPYVDDLGADAFLVSTGENSDLYRYVLMYVIGWCVAVLTLIIFFYYVKQSSNFEAMFYQPPRRGDPILFKVVRPLTPWSR